MYIQGEVFIIFALSYVQLGLGYFSNQEENDKKCHTANQNTLLEPGIGRNAC